MPKKFRMQESKLQFFLRLENFRFEFRIFLKASEVHCRELHTLRKTLLQVLKKWCLEFEIVFTDLFFQTNYVLLASLTLAVQLISRKITKDKHKKQVNNKFLCHNEFLSTIDVQFLIFCNYFFDSAFFFVSSS